jgi:hypothetical protein
VDGHHHRVFPNRNEVLRHGLHVVVDVQEARKPPLETVEPAIAIGVREVGDLHQHELRAKDRRERLFFEGLSGAHRLSGVLGELVSAPDDLDVRVRHRPPSISPCRRSWKGSGARSFEALAVVSGTAMRESRTYASVRRFAWYPGGTTAAGA